MLNKNTLLAAICLGLATTACSDMTEPAVEQVPEFALVERVLEEYPDATIEEQTIKRYDFGSSLGDPGIDGNDAPINTLEHRSTAPILEVYNTSFQAVQGQTTIFILYYRVIQGGKPKRVPFLSVKIPENAQLLRGDGSPAFDGEAIDITVQIDPRKFLLHFGPHGSTFVDGEPAEVWFNLRFADFGERDPAELTGWYQPQTGGDWTPINSNVRVGKRFIKFRIRHFSNYSVAW